MAQTDSAPNGHLTEKTFSAFNKDQGKVYADARRDYHPSVYQTVIEHHTSTGGQLDFLVDLGCGPGNVTRALALQFTHATGLDPSEGMVSTARSISSDTKTAGGETIYFARSTAESIGSDLPEPIGDDSVDLITAGNAAHWFSMPPFWARAARVLKPGGSVALWTSGHVRAHPSMPNADAINAAIDQHQEQHLQPYRTAGNDLTRGRYSDLPLPWTLAKSIPEFDESTFFRKEWDVGEQFHIGKQEADMDSFEKMMGTGSPVVRWRQAHPEAVGTERDVVRLLRREIERLMHEAGIEPGHEVLKGAVAGVVLMVKKKA